MPVRVKKSSVNAAVADFNEQFVAMRDSGDISLDDLVDLTSSFNILLERARAEIYYGNSTELAVKEFMADMLNILNELHQCAQSKKIEPSPLLPKRVALLFANFIDKVSTYEQRQKFSKATKAIPYVKNVVLLAKNLPYFWQYASNKEKVVVVLSAALMVTAAVFTIGAIVAPTPFSAVIAPMGILMLASVGEFLFRYTMEGAKMQAKDRKAINKILKENEQQRADILLLLEEKFQKPKKHSLILSNDYTQNEETKELSSIAHPEIDPANRIKSSNRLTSQPSKPQDDGTVLT